MCLKKLVSQTNSRQWIDKRSICTVFTMCRSWSAFSLFEEKKKTQSFLASGWSENQTSTDQGHVYPKAWSRPVSDMKVNKNSRCWRSRSRSLSRSFLQVDFVVRAGHLVDPGLPARDFGREIGLGVRDLRFLRLRCICSATRFKSQRLFVVALLNRHKSFLYIFSIFFFGNRRTTL